MAFIPHQSSLEGVLDFFTPALSDEEQAMAEEKFMALCDHFEAKPGSDRPYSKPRLLRYTYVYARSRDSKKNFLELFADSAGIAWTEDIASSMDSLQQKFDDFAVFLFNEFFTPMKAAGNCTTRVLSKAHSSALERLRSGHVEVRTPDRLSALRSLCLERDHHRCVVTRAFDSSEMVSRLEASQHARDDDGNLLNDEQIPPDALDVAHILPHALTKAQSMAQPELSNAQKTTLKLLNMFDFGVANVIDGVDIDRPRNAITIKHTMHSHFGNYDIYFQRVTGTPANEHTYRIDSFLPTPLNRLYKLPVTRTFWTTPTIDPPEQRFLDIHSAIAHILHLSGAGDHIDKLLRDLEKDYVRADGSTRLDEMIRLRLGGWIDGAVRG